MDPTQNLISPTTLQTMSSDVAAFAQQQPDATAQDSFAGVSMNPAQAADTISRQRQTAQQAQDHIALLKLQLEEAQARLLLQAQSDIPRVCFCDFWGGKCTKQKCEFCGPNSMELGRKYWAYIVPLLVVHRYKPHGSTLTYTKGAALQKPIGTTPNRDQKASKLDRLDEEEEDYPGDLEDGT